MSPGSTGGTPGHQCMFRVNGIMTHTGHYAEWSQVGSAALLMGSRVLGGKKITRSL